MSLQKPREKGEALTNALARIDDDVCTWLQEQLQAHDEVNRTNTTNFQQVQGICQCLDQLLNFIAAAKKGQPRNGFGQTIASV